jgi:hypothetical protein
MSTPSLEVREVQLSEIAKASSVTVDDVRVVFLASYDARRYADPENEICRLVDGDKAYCITDSWLDDINTCGWILNRLPALARPGALNYILHFLHDKLEDPADKAFRAEMHAKMAEVKAFNQTQETLCTAIPQG